MIFKNFYWSLDIDLKPNMSQNNLILFRRTKNMKGQRFVALIEQESLIELRAMY